MKIKPVKAWGIVNGNGKLCAYVNTDKAMAKFNAGFGKVIRVEIHPMKKEPTK